MITKSLMIKPVDRVDKSLLPHRLWHVADYLNGRANRPLPRPVGGDEGAVAPPHLGVKNLGLSSVEHLRIKFSGLSPSRKNFTRSKNTK